MAAPRCWQWWGDSATTKVLGLLYLEEEEEMQAELSQIVNVFLTENQLELDEKDNETLEKYNLLTLK